MSQNMNKTKPKMQNKSSTVIPIRISREQLEELRTLPPDVSISALARALFKAYLNGSLGEHIREEIYDEVSRTKTAIRNSKQNLIALNRGKEKQENEPEQAARRTNNGAALRANLLNSFEELHRRGTGTDGM